MKKDNFWEISKALSNGLKDASRIWDGRKAILEMKDANSPHWKQMEWIGWYFQFLSGRLLKDITKIPGPKYGNAEFDGFKEIPWDFKAHAINTSSHQIIVNDSEATAKAITEFGCVGLILAMGKVKYNDNKRTFQKWHEGIKSGKSKYEFERVKRGAWSRLRKVEFRLEQISFIKIDDSALVKCGSFQRDFRNSNGMPRREKVLVNLEKLEEEIVHFLDFQIEVE